MTQNSTTTVELICDSCNFKSCSSLCPGWHVLYNAAKEGRKLDANEIPCEKCPYPFPTPFVGTIINRDVCFICCRFFSGKHDNGGMEQLYERVVK